MSKTVAELQEELIKQMKQINKTREIASRKPIEKTTIQELNEENFLPPYSLTGLAADKLGRELFMDLTEEPSNGRVRSKFEKGVNKAIAGVLTGTMFIMTMPFVAAVDSIFSIPQLGINGAQSVVYKNYNKNIEKAKTKLKNLEHEYNKTLEEFHKAKQQEQQSGLEL